MKKLLIICSILMLFTGKVDLFGSSFLFDIQSILDVVTDISDLSTNRHDLTAGNMFKKKTDATLTAVNQLSDQINELTQSFNVKMDQLMTAVLEDTPRAIQFNNLMRRLLDYIARIDELYEDYLFYVSESGVFARHTIEGFGKAVTSHRFGAVQDILKQIYYLIFPGKTGRQDDSLLDVMVASLRGVAELELCDNLKTNQQQLFELYETIVITEIKGYAIISYAYGMLAIYRNTSFDAEMERTYTQTVKRCVDYLTGVRNTLKSVRHEIFLCDPLKHKKGKTFVALNSINRVVVQEAMMYSSCKRSDCDEISQDYYLERYDWSPLQPCHGLMYDCDNVGEYMTICELPPEFEKRYDWVQSNNLFGTMNDCSNGTRRKIDSYAKWGDDGVCQTCYCKCSEQKPKSKAIRTISLRPQLADINNNMVVTGVRFEQKDMMIHVQIEQGKMLPGGQIEQSSVQWKELEDFKYLEEGDEGKFVKINGDDEENLEHGTDYQFIHEGQREVYLDNVYSQEPGYVVTGLKMSQDPENSAAVQLDLHITLANATTGLLEPTNDKPSKWITHKDMPNGYRNFTQRKIHDVTEWKRGDGFYDNVPFLKFADFSKILFTISSRWTDAGQSTIPFFDRQTIAPAARLALSGVSLLHRGKEESGGFLGFKVRTINLYDFLNSDLDTKTTEQYLKSFDNMLDTTMPEVDK